MTRTATPQQGAGEILLAGFDALFVINLPSRPDRRREFAEQLAKMGLSFDHPKIRLFPAVRPQDKGAFSTIGARGCFMSHLGVLRQAVDAKHEAIIICEDDLDFSEDFRDRLPNLGCVLERETWDMIYGGYQDAPGGAPVASSISFIKVPAGQHIRCTHFILLRGRMIADLVRYLEKMLERPDGDPEGGPMHVDGAYSWFRTAHPEIRTLAAVPPLGHQRPSRTDIHDLRWFDRAPLVRDIVQAMRRLK